MRITQKKENLESVIFESFMKPKKIKGILFDFDGVLAKTMEDNFNAWKLAMQDYEVKLRREDYYPLEGMPMKEIAGKYCKEFNIDESLAEEIVRKKENYYLENHHLEFYPGVEEFIDLLKSKKILIGLVSAASNERLRNTVPKNFLKKFDTVVSGDRTLRGKPFPDPYLKGLSDLNLKREECIAVENAPVGIKSAKNANLYCIAVCSTLDKSYLKEADEIVEEFKDLNKVVFG